MRFDRLVQVRLILIAFVVLALWGLAPHAGTFVSAAPTPAAQVQEEAEAPAQDEGVEEDEGIVAPAGPVEEDHGEGHGDDHGHGPSPPVWLVLPFVILLLMIATGPLFYQHHWHHHYPKYSVALGIIVALWVAILGTMAAFRRVSRRATLLLAPYLLWVSFAAVLNFELWRLN